MVVREDIIDRLAQFGVVVDEADYATVEFELNKIIDYVKNYCNITTIPEILDRRIIDRICAEYLFLKKNSGTLSNFDYDTVIKQIKEGDTTVQYATGDGNDTPESRFDAFVRELNKGFDKWLTPHRRLRW